jgi:DNA-directed RNA polymerase specialized sigma24 family protein
MPTAIRRRPSLIWFAGIFNLVHSVALRFAGNSADAQDVTQAVFIIFAQKAASLRQRTILTGWLYETTRFTARQLLRSRVRQQAREQEAEACLRRTSVRHNLKLTGFDGECSTAYYADMHSWVLLLKLLEVLALASGVAHFSEYAHKASIWTVGFLKNA